MPVRDRTVRYMRLGAVAVVAIAAAVTWLATRAEAWPGRLWVQTEPYSAATQARAAPSPGADAAYECAWWDDVSACSARATESRVRGFLAHVGVPYEREEREYWMTPLALRRGEVTWRELIPAGGPGAAADPDDEVVALWTHADAAGARWDLRLLASGDVAGWRSPARWARVGRELVVCPVAKTSREAPMSFRRWQKLCTSPDWAERFQATVADDGRSYAGLDASGREVRGMAARRD